MTCEVGSRVSNGQGNVARNVQTVHSLPPCFSSPHSCPPLSVSSIYLWQPDVFSASFIYALFHQRGIPAAKCHGKLSLKIRNEFISLSFSPFPPLLSFLSSPCLPRSSLFSPCMQSLANDPELSCLEKMESICTQSLDGKIKEQYHGAFYFSVHEMRIINFRRRTWCALFMSLEAASD